MTICVDGNLSTFKSHEIADSLETDLHALNKVHSVIIHVHPINVPNNAEIKEEK